MGNAWDSFLQEVGNDIICDCSLRFILELFYWYCHEKKRYLEFLILHYENSGNVYFESVFKEKLKKLEENNQRSKGVNDLMG